MTTPPAQMIDRWHHRAEPGPGESTVYWHMLMNDYQQVAELARDAQQRLARFPGLHMTPLERLHMTTLVAGPADHFSQDQLRQMIKAASAKLADTPAITVTVGGIVYHPEAIMLGVKPKRALASVHDAVRAATRAVTGSHDPDGTPARWIPHITICYSTAEQALAPIIAALGPQQRQCQIQISTISLVIQHGPERLWDWRTAGTVHLAEPAGTQALLPALPAVAAFVLRQEMRDRADSSGVCPDLRQLKCDTCMGTGRLFGRLGDSGQAGQGGALEDLGDVVQRDDQFLEPVQRGVVLPVQQGAAVFLRGDGPAGQLDLLAFGAEQGLDGGVQSQG